VLQESDGQSMTSLAGPAAVCSDDAARFPSAHLLPHVDHARSLSAGSSASGGDEHRMSGYLQPLVGSAAASAHPSKYLQLLTAAAASTPQLAAARRRPADYSPLVRDANDSSGTSLVAAADTVPPQHDTSRRPATAYPPMRPGPSPLYGRHAVRERRAQSMNCDRTG